MRLTFGVHRTPLGPVTVTLDRDALCGLDFEEQASSLHARLERRFGCAPAHDETTTRAVTERLDRYFAGDLRALEDLQVNAGGTPLQTRVWAALRKIPAGETRTYEEVARVLGAPNAVRAVGAANGKNPVALVVPCHRVIGKDGTLTGYAGGIERKRWLLEHERTHAGLAGTQVCFATLV